MERDRDYYYMRAESELALAEQSSSPNVLKAHYELAGYYLDLAYGDDDEGTPSERDRRFAVAFPEAPQLIARLRAAGIILLGEAQAESTN